MDPKRYFKLILILGSLTALGPFSIDMYLPGFPDIARDLKTDVATVGLSLSSFFIGISLGQLLYGPLLDRFGRKPPLYAGLIVYILTSLACARATSIETLIVLRFVQAVGSCAAAVASVAMVRDLFPVRDNAKVFARLMLVLGTSPMIAPTVGGYITSTYHWPPVFLLLAAMALVILAAVYFLLPESSKPNPGFSLRPKSIIVNFAMVLRNPQFYTYATVGAISLSGLLVYVSGSPLLFMEVFKVDGKMYGWIFAFLSVGFIGSGQLNGMLLKKYSSEQLIVAAILFQCLVGLTLVVLTYFHLIGLFATIAMIFLYLCCVGFVLPNCSALAMAPFAEGAGSASSLLGAGQMGISALATVLLSVVNNHTAVPVTVMMFSAGVVAISILLIGRRGIPSELKPAGDFPTKKRSITDAG